MVETKDPNNLQGTLVFQNLTQSKKNVSISLGCAYTDEIGQTSFKKLLNEADKKMYEQKEIIHHQD